MDQSSTRGKIITLKKVAKKPRNSILAEYGKAIYGIFAESTIDDAANRIVANTFSDAWVHVTGQEGEISDADVEKFMKNEKSVDAIFARLKVAKKSHAAAARRLAKNRFGKSENPDEIDPVEKIANLAVEKLGKIIEDSKLNVENAKLNALYPLFAGKMSGQGRENDGQALDSELVRTLLSHEISIRRMFAFFPEDSAEPKLEQETPKPQLTIVQ